MRVSRVLLVTAALAVVPGLLYAGPGLLGIRASSSNTPNTFIDFNGGDFVNFDAVTRELELQGVPASTDFGTGPRFHAPGGEVTIRIRVLDNLANSVAGTAGDDFVLTGGVDIDGNGTIDASETGTLLKGEIIELGWFNQANPAALDQLDFRFTPTGGLLAPYYAGGAIGIAVNIEGSSWAAGADFGSSFHGFPKGNVFPVCGGRIGDYVWEDLDVDGVQDSGEPPIVGALLTLKDAANAVIATTNSDGAGFYLFSKKDSVPPGTDSALCPGDYTVTVTPPAGYFPTVQCDPIADPACTEATDSNPPPPLSPGAPAPVSLTTSKAVDLTIDFGFFRKASLGDFVWKDENGNGIQDAGEPGVKDVTVELYDCGNVLRGTKQTDANGFYLFDQLMPGDYYVTFYPPGGLAFTQRFQGGDPATDSDADPATGVSVCTTLSSGEQDLTIDAGLIATGPGCIGDFVWLDVDGDGVQDPGEPGFNKVSVWLYRPNGVTTLGETVNGLYLFENLTPGEYKVCVGSALEDYTQTYDLDFPATPHCATITLLAGQCRKDVDFGYAPPVDPGDRVWHDLNGNKRQDAGEPGLNGVTVHLKNAAGVIIATQETTRDGNYGFAAPSTGTYTVCVVKPAGFFPTYDLDFPATPNCATVFVEAGQQRTDVDFGYQKAASIGDRVWNDLDGDGKLDSGEAGLAWVVKLTRPDGTVKKVTATAAGKYSFPNLGPGTYKVCVVPVSGYTQTYDVDGVGSANCAAVGLSLGQARTDVDFGYR